MTISRDLFFAILSMDSYNRDYGFSVRISVSTIGNAEILSRDRLQITQQQYESWQSAGFYALAYDLTGAGIAGLSGTVISYRGTNFNINWNPLTFRSSPLIADVINGWSVGAGLAGAQAGLALDFYNAVKRDGIDARITPTGHSLGGIDFRPQMLKGAGGGCAAAPAAANDNEQISVWREAAFTLAIAA
jgi:hypothetical protein